MPRTTKSRDLESSYLDLIEHYIQNRNWYMVEVLFNQLGRYWEGQNNG